MSLAKGLLHSDGESFLNQFLSQRFAGLYEVHPNVALKEFIDCKSSLLNDEEASYIFNGAHVDTLVCKTSGKKRPVMGVEYDEGRHHQSIKQKSRDGLKNKIFKKAGLLLYRCKRAHITPNRFNETVIGAFLDQYLKMKYWDVIGKSLSVLNIASSGIEKEFHCAAPFKIEFESLASEIVNSHGSAEFKGTIYSSDQDDEDELEKFSWASVELIKGEKILAKATGLCDWRSFPYCGHAAAERYAFIGCLKLALGQPIENFPFVGNSPSFDIDDLEEILCELAK